MSGNEKPLIEIEKSILESPALYLEWSRKFLAQSSSEKLAQILSDLDTPVSDLRAARVYSGMGENQKWESLARKVSDSPDLSMRINGMTELIFHELECARPTNRPVFQSLNTVLIDYQKILSELQNRTLLHVETECNLLLCLANNLIESNEFEEARKWLGQSIILAKQLGIEGVYCAIYSLMALAALRLGWLDIAHDEYQIILNCKDATNFQRQNALINQAVISGFAGDGVASVEGFQNLLNSEPNQIQALASHQHIRGLLGVLPVDECTVPDPSNNYGKQIDCLRLLLKYFGKSNMDLLHQVISTLRDWSPNGSNAKVMRQWLQAISFFHLKKPMMAIRAVSNCDSQFPATKLLLLGMKLEIALIFDGIELDPCHKLAEQIEDLLIKSKSNRSKSGLAALLAFWHPTAAAFCAFSPVSTPELFEFGNSMVFSNEKPIVVYGKPVSSRLPFVQTTLAEFLFNVKIKRDQSVELKRIRDVQEAFYGSNVYIRPVISPAFIAYNLHKAGLKAGEIWKRAARDLASTHGLVPSTQGEYLRAERFLLHKELGRFLADEISLEDFKRRISQEDHLSEAR